MTRQTYATDVTDAEWRDLEPHLPAPKLGGRPRRHAVREILHALVSVLRSGGAWRLWPHDLPPWTTVYHDFSLGRVRGLWPAWHKALQTVVRRQAGRNPHPRAGIIDRQAVKTTLVGGPRGEDGGKNVHGRQRPLLVDTPGLLIRAIVPPADLADGDGAKRLLAPLQGHVPRLQHIWAASASRGKARAWLHTPLSGTVEIVQHWWTGRRWGWGGPGQEPPTIPRGFHVLPRRWVVEGTFAWLVTYRRLSKDDEERPETSEALIYLAMSRLMIKRLAA